MLTPSYFALYTEHHDPHAEPTAFNPVKGELLLVFRHRDHQTRADITGTLEALRADGQVPFVLEYEHLRNIPEVVLGGANGNHLAPVAFADEPVGEPFPHPSPIAPAGQEDFHDANRILAIHQCLKLLAGQCDGARQLDGHGFNKLDAEFGHRLANARGLSPKQAAHGYKLVKKYHRQLPPDLLAAAEGDHSHPEPKAQSPEPDSRPLHELITPGQPHTFTPAEIINRLYHYQSGDAAGDNGCDEPYGDTYQNGVRPGSTKLFQFKELLHACGIPALYAQENAGRETMVYVKLFDPSGSWTWYLTEYSDTAPDGTPHLAFGLVDGHEAELGYIDIHELAHTKGAASLGIEIDMHFRPTLLTEIKEQLQSKAN